ncbi:MAG TPA: glycosyltransferase [Chitinophagaceae bacterium]|nr:glycosyltransferase [Chitinophagaceae bacterium]
MSNIGILFKDFGPYHVARIEALADALKTKESSLFAYRFYESSRNYAWKTMTPENAKVITLGNENASGVVEAFRVAFALGRSIRKQKIKAVFLPSYSPLPNMLCIFSAKMAGSKIILMNESWEATERASFFGRLAKHFLVRLFNSALVGGTPQKQYACAYGQLPSKVFLGYDAVDVKYYEQQSAQWKNETPGKQPVPNLPPRYFLNLGRFVSKKNIPLLIKAYSRLLKRYPLLDIALVLVGEGEEEKALKDLVTELQVPLREGMLSPNLSQKNAEVVFYPFQQIDKTPFIFSRSEAFILPSLYEEWGLVVNEAMASSTTVIVSKNVGCAADLVINGINGFQFNPESVEQLEEILEKFVKDPMLADRLGNEGYRHIKNWGPERFAEGAINAIAATAI